MVLFWVLVFVVPAIAGVIRMLMAVYTPRAYGSMLAEEERRRQRRNSALATGIGLAARFMRK